MTGKRTIVFLCIYWLSFDEISSKDSTIQPGAKGTEVVDAVIDLIQHTCIFPDDKFFLRRLALVESLNGKSGSTYRTGYYGGIWQVDKDRFTVTKTSAPVQKYFNDIRSKFNIDWTRVTWQDLIKPLYSGLAARLYIEVINNGQESRLPRDVEEQAAYWRTKYHSGSPRASKNFTATASLLTQHCTGDKAIDLVFILDSSGSVARSDFELAKVFTQRVIDAFTVGPENTRVAVIKYSSGVWVEFYLDTYSDKQLMQNRIQQIQYIGGGTNTGDAIDVAVHSVFKNSSLRARNVPKVAILVTDGQSSFIQTSAAARRARDVGGITMFAVGVGSGVNLMELNEVATDPDCTHVFTVQDFSRIKELRQEIQKASCTSHVNYPAKGNTTVSCTITKSCPSIKIPPQVQHNNTSSKNDTDTGVEKVPAVVTKVNCGSATVYASYSNPNPGAAYYEIRVVATVDQPAHIFLTKDEPLYVSVQGTPLKLLETNGNISCVAVTSVQEVNPRVEVQCIDIGEERNCLPKDLMDFRAEICREPWTFPNPCTMETVLSGKTLFPHPYDSEQYLMCDMAGKVYIVHCPQRELYHSETETCGGGETPGGRDRRLDHNATNPCTADAIFSGELFFSYPPDKHKFIHCDVWGKAWTMDCPSGFVWDEEALTCVVEGVIIPGLLESGLSNPCTKDNIANNKLFHPYPKSNTMYIHCDIWGDAWVMPCNPGFIWHPEAVTCIPGNAT